jgi:hypothetical protein
MGYLIEEDIVKFAHNVDELSSFIENDNFNVDFDKDYFFSGI